MAWVAIITGIRAAPAAADILRAIAFTGDSWAGLHVCCLCGEAIKAKLEVEASKCCIVRAYGRNNAFPARIAAGGLAGIDVESSSDTARTISLAALAVRACSIWTRHTVVLSGSKLALLCRAR